jgi:hypothetical protein
MNDTMAQASTTEFVREIITDTRELVRLEIALAKRESLTEIARARAAMLATAVAAVAANLALVMACVTVTVSTHASSTVAGLFAIAFFVVATTAAIAALRRFPRDLFSLTRRCIREDAQMIGESGAWTLPTNRP